MYIQIDSHVELSKVEKLRENRLQAKRVRRDRNERKKEAYVRSKGATEESASESSRGESFISEGKKIVHEENMILPPVPQEEPQCVSTLSLLHWIIIVTLLHYI